MKYTKEYNEVIQKISHGGLTILSNDYMDKLFDTNLKIKLALFCSQAEINFATIFRSSLQNNYNSNQYKYGALIYFKGNLLGVLKFFGEKSFYCFSTYRDGPSEDDNEIDHKHLYMISERLYKDIKSVFEHKENNGERDWLRVNINRNLFFMKPQDKKKIKRTTHNHVVSKANEIYEIEKHFVGEYDININDFLYDYLLDR